MAESPHPTQTFPPLTIPAMPSILGAYSRFTDKSLNPDYGSAANTSINYAGLVVLAALLLSMRLWAPAALLVLAGPIIEGSFHAYSPHPAQLGATCLAMVLPLALFAMTGRAQKFWVVIGLLSLPAAMMLRQAIGEMGAVASLVALAYSAYPRRSIRPAVAAALAVATVLAALSPATIIRARDQFYGFPAPAFVEGHGISHSLYIGLGVVKNPWGIKWLDDSGFEKVRSIDPSVANLSHRYFEILNQEYWKIVYKNPFRVILVYLEKLGDSLGKRFHSWLWLRIPNFIIIGVTIFALIRARRVENWPPSALATVRVASLFLILFFAQASIINPMLLYLFPIQIPILVLIGICIQISVERRARTTAPQPRLATV